MTDDCPTYTEVHRPYEDLLQTLIEQWTLDDAALRQKYTTLRTLADQRKQRQVQQIQSDYEESIQSISSQESHEHNQVTADRLKQVKRIMAGKGTLWPQW